MKKTCFFIMMGLVTLQPAFAELDLGDIRNLVEQDETLWCEYISIQDGMFAPVNINLQFTASQNFRGIVDPLDGNLQYSEETVIGEDEGNFRFSTESIGNFRITFTDTYNETNIERQYYYRIEVSDADNNANIEKEVGNWRTDERTFCKVMEFRTEEPFRERTEEEILAIVDEDQQKRDAITQGLIGEVRAAVVVVAIGLTILAVYIGIEKIFKMLNRSKEERDMNKIKQFHTNEIKRLQDIGKYLIRAMIDLKNDYNTFRNIMHTTLVEWVEHVSDKSKPEPFVADLTQTPNPYLNYHNDIADFDLKKMAKDTIAKLRKQEKDEVTKFVESLKEKPLGELYDMYDDYQANCVKDPYNMELQNKAKTILAEIERVVKMHG